MFDSVVERVENEINREKRDLLRGTSDCDDRPPSGSVRFDRLGELCSRILASARCLRSASFSLDRISVSSMMKNFSNPRSETELTVRWMPFIGGLGASGTDWSQWLVLQSMGDSWRALFNITRAPKTQSRRSKQRAERSKAVIRTQSRALVLRVGVDESRAELEPDETRSVSFRVVWQSRRAL